MNLGHAKRLANLLRIQALHVAQQHGRTLIGRQSVKVLGDKCHELAPGEDSFRCDTLPGQRGIHPGATLREPVEVESAILVAVEAGPQIREVAHPGVAYGAGAGFVDHDRCDPASQGGGSGEAVQPGHNRQPRLLHNFLGGGLDPAERPRKPDKGSMVPRHERPKRSLIARAQTGDEFSRLGGHFARRSLTTAPRPAGTAHGTRNQPNAAGLPVSLAPGLS